MTTSAWRIACVATPLALIACGYSEPSLPVTSVSPSRAYSDAPVPIVLGGGPFRPALVIDTGSGSVSTGGGAFTVTLVSDQDRVPATSVVWAKPNEIDATVPAGIAAASYDVLLRDPRGQTVTLPRGFQSLGRDGDAPQVTIDDPPAGAHVSPRASVSVHITADDDLTADDGLGHLASISADASSPTLGTVIPSCPPISGGPHQATCSFVFNAPSAPTPTETITISATATDVNGNHRTVLRTIEVAWVPVVLSIAPTEGPASGLTHIQIKGTSFIAGLSQILVDGQPIMPDGDADGVVSDREIDGITLAHGPGVAQVTVANGPGRATPPLEFEFVAPPRVKIVEPPSGPESSPTSVRLVGDHFRMGETKVAIIDADGTRQQLADDSVSVASSFVINTVLPPGHGVITIVVVDPISGETELPAAFSYTSDAPAPGGGPAP